VKEGKVVIYTYAGRRLRKVKELEENSNVVKTNNESKLKEDDQDVLDKGK